MVRGQDPGDLIGAVGPDRLLWGTDSIWYGSPQSQIEAFRAFEITPFHSGSHGDPHPPSEPFGVLRPPVRIAFPDGATHRAAVTGSATRVGAPVVDDPVAQALADERSGAGTGAPGEVVVTGTSIRGAAPVGSSVVARMNASSCTCIPVW